MSTAPTPWRRDRMNLLAVMASSVISGIDTGLKRIAELRLAEVFRTAKSHGTRDTEVFLVGCRKLLFATGH